MIRKIFLSKEGYKLREIRNETMMMKEIEETIAYYDKLREERENRFFKTAGPRATLHAALSRLSKAELDFIRRTHEFSNMSALNKADLVMGLSKKIPIALKSVLFIMDNERIELFRSVMKQSGVISYEELTPMEREEMRKYGFLFHGIERGEKILFMPEELLKILKELDTNELRQRAQRNTEWILLSQGLLYYIGVMNRWELSDKISSLTHEEVDITEFIEVISGGSHYYGELDIVSIHCIHKNVHDRSKILWEHNTRKGIGFAPFTKHQLLKAGKPGYVEKTPQMKSFIAFLHKHYILSANDADAICEDIIQVINETGDPMMILKYLQLRLDPPDYDVLDDMIFNIMELYNHTRQWDLKGYFPTELSANKKESSKMKAPYPYSSNVVPVKSIETAQPVKVGRNDPCPCGSKKKYKKCCGS